MWNQVQVPHEGCPEVAPVVVFMPIAAAPMHGPESASRVGSSRGPFAIT